MFTKKDWKINPERTAFVTIDLQKAFMTEGAPIYCRKATEFIPKVNAVADECRKAGIPVIHVGQSMRPDLADGGLLPEIRPRVDTEWEATEGKAGAEFYQELEIDDKDFIVKKIRYSAFAPGSSNIERLLRGMGRDSLIVCGIATDVCVGVTVYDAMMLDFRVFLVGDLTATLNDERQKVGLEVIEKHFAKLVTADEVCQELQKSATKS